MNECFNILASGMGLIDLVVAAAQAPAGVRRAVVFLALLVALLGAFVFVIALITALRRRARRESAKADRKNLTEIDPWQEAGRRARP